MLPDAQRLVLLAADLLKTGFLQQDATNRDDTYCAPEKQVRLLRIFVTFLRRARGVIQAGAPIAQVRELEVVPRLRRAKLTTDMDDLDRLAQEMQDQLDQLEGQYG